MSCAYAIYEAKNKLTDIVHQVESGAPVEFTRHGKPVAVLVGHTQFLEMANGLQTFSSACKRYRTRWHTELAAEAEASYSDPFESIRDKSTGRELDL
jgi:prevent-host-death family protein